MPLIDPNPLSERESFDFEMWTRDECYSFYVAQRWRACNYRQLLDLWLCAPYCEGCALSDPLCQSPVPEISPVDWKQDVLDSLGDDTLRAIQGNRRQDPDWALSCKRCSRDLRPWSRDDVWVVTYHLEEHYRIPTVVPNQNASRRLGEIIKKLYGRKCFRCGSSDSLHLDHILPRSKGGTAAFRNLQPLCELCGQKKGSGLPTEVTVYSNLYFESDADSRLGLFW